MPRRPLLAAAISLCTLSCALAFSAAPALAIRGHVFERSFGKGELKEPAGVAVNEASGDVYVVDKGNNRVERFNSAGVFQSEIAGPSGEGAGSLTEGSETITSVLISTGAFSVGEEITAPALPAGTFITAVVPGTLTVSKKAGKPTQPTETLKAHESFSGPEGLASGDGIAVDNSTSAEDPSAGAVYVVDAGHSVVDKFTATGLYVGQITGPAATSFNELGDELRGVAVDPKGSVDVYIEPPRTNERGVYSFSDANVNEPSGFVETRVFLRATSQFAVDAEGDLYVGEGNEQVSKFDSGGKLLIESLVSEPGSAVAVEGASGDPFVANLTHVNRLSPAGAGLESFGAGVLSHSGGIAVDSAGGGSTVFVADAAAGIVDVFGLAPAAAPVVEDTSVAAVTSDIAEVRAKINPASVAGEKVTDYFVEYGACADAVSCGTAPFASHTAVGSLPADFEPHQAEVALEALAPATLYHFRVVAENGHGVARSGELRFTTQNTAGFGLPDHRQWELVSPVDKHGAEIEPIKSEALVQGSAAGDAIAYVTSLPPTVEPKGYTLHAPVVSSRGPGGWVTQDIGIPHEHETGVTPGHLDEYYYFSEDLHFGVVQPAGSYIPAGSPQALSPKEASEQTAFLRTDFVHETPGAPCQSECYRPLVTGAPGYANVTPAGTAFGEEGLCPTHEGNNKSVCGPEFEGASADTHHVILKSGVALTGTPIPETGLYEWNANKPPAEQLKLVSVLPGEAAEPGKNANLGGGVSHAARNAVSTDGSRVFWSTSEHLYMRDVGRGETVRMDAPGEGGLDAALGSSEGFQAASSDGSRAYFTDGVPLTADSGASSGSPDLYECAIVVTAGKLTCVLTDLTPLSNGQSAEVQGLVSGASEDGSRVYFVANGSLGNTGAPRGNCRGGHSGRERCNLYAYHNGEVRLVAVLSGEDSTTWGGQFRNFPSLTARVSPNGEYLAFMSSQPLTGYDTRDAVSGKPDHEVYEYSARTGRVVCASCDPSGARPVGFEASSRAGGPALGGGEWPEGTWIAANVPGWSPYGLTLALHQSRYLSNNGRLFFNTSDALVSKDQNRSQEDVYQFEPAGEGDCTSSTSTGSVVFSPSANGCVGLISSGSSGDESGFLDASETGSDVFIVTQARLSPSDIDNSLDIYDAHECSASSPCPAAPAAEPPPACGTADSCRAAPTPQPELFGAPASWTFSGPGNLTPAPPPHVGSHPNSRIQLLAKALKACRKKHHRARIACERRARARYGASHDAGRASQKTRQA